MRARGLTVDHVTVLPWVQRHAPEINKRMRQHLKMSGTSYRLDETYVKVGSEWKYLYRAVDSVGNTIEFMLSAERDVSAAKRFFRKLMRADHRRLPFTIATDKHASYPEAFAASVKPPLSALRPLSRSVGFSARKAQTRRCWRRPASPWATTSPSRPSRRPRLRRR